MSESKLNKLARISLNIEFGYIALFFIPKMGFKYYISLHRGPIDVFYTGSGPYWLQQVAEAERNGYPIEVILLFSGAKDIKQLKQAEILLISYFESIRHIHGCNRTRGGDYDKEDKDIPLGKVKQVPYNNIRRLKDQLGVETKKTLKKFILNKGIVSKNLRPELKKESKIHWILDTSKYQASKTKTTMNKQEVCKESKNDIGNEMLNIVTEDMNKKRDKQLQELKRFEGMPDKLEAIEVNLEGINQAILSIFKIMEGGFQQKQDTPAEEMIKHYKIVKGIKRLLKDEQN